MWLYRWLLRLYPTGFRAEYGDEMQAVFIKKRRAASGVSAILAVWLEAVLDVIRHAVPLHLDALRQDVRYTLRSLARTPSFTLNNRSGSVIFVLWRRSSSARAMRSGFGRTITIRRTCILRKPVPCSFCYSVLRRMKSLSARCTI